MMNTEDYFKLEMKVQYLYSGFLFINRILPGAWTLSLLTVRSFSKQAKRLITYRLMEVCRQCTTS